MSTIGNFVSITPAAISELYQLPEKIHAFLEDIDRAWHGIYFL